MSDDGTDQIPGPGDQYHASGPASRTRADQPMVARQLVRDPYSRLGGVASGLAHYFGLDVSIVRLGFILFTFFSGAGIVVYLLAWLVVPRAEYWPPVGGIQPNRSISAREVGIGLAVLGTLLFLFFNGGGTARVFVPALLIAGGVWLLRQPEHGTVSPSSPSASGAAPGVGDAGVAADPLAYPAPDEWTLVDTDADPALAGAPALNPSVTPASTSSSTPFSSPGAPQPADTLVDAALAPPAIPPSVTSGPTPGAPVPPRRRRWRRIVFGLFLLFILLPLIVIALIVGLLLSNGVSFGGGFDSEYRPESVAEIPDSIRQDAGEIVLDLTELDLAEFTAPIVPTPPTVPTPPEVPTPPGGLAAPDAPEAPEAPELPTLEELELPVPIEIDLDFGEVRVIVPEGLDIVVDAEVDLGDVEVFGQSRGGFDNRVTADADDPMIQLEIDVGAGEILVERR